MLLSIQGGSNLGIFEINDAAKLVQEAVHPEANIIFGAVIDDTLGDEVRVTVIAAGFDGGEPHVARDGRRAGLVEALVPAAVSAGIPAGIPAGMPLSSSEGATGSQEWAAVAEVTTLTQTTDLDHGYDEDDDDLDIPDFLKG
ncbi:hypothetical protein GCM10025866_32590 [Naasia aerilata]|uniref:Cell division protein FtsZ C-terminal domain-containing protein n=1 Tax=Naasia aerilata TaxID=1162966 RepID=A0ABM8GGT8_9MICO|nr:hypothetical protein GCM10025866_32590 [Naasia aerilata]